MIYHSPHFSNHFDIVSSVYKNLPANSSLIIREHPLYQNKYEKKLYNFARSNSIVFDNNTPLKDAFEHANVVVVNNSTVGVEAISQNKTVVVLGNAYYDNAKICLKYDGNTCLKSLLEQALNFQPKIQNINNFLYDLINSNLVKGQIKGKDLKAAKHIANIISTQN